jgi:Holliday junction resolvase
VYGATQGDFDRSQVQAIIKSSAERFARAVAESPRELDAMEWRDVERMLAEVFEGMGFKTVLTPGSKDGGRDIILECVVSGKLHTYIVEVKHWKSGKVTVGKVTNFLRIVVKENRNAGLFLSTYGYSASVFETLLTLERERLRIGEEEKIVSLCKSYVTAASGIVVPPDVLEVALFEGTQ